jgi:hypothetical protein
LIVIGRDQGPDSVASEATVVVHVEDVNDNAPTIVASTLNQALGTGTQRDTFSSRPFKQSFNSPRMPSNEFLIPDVISLHQS